MMKKIVCILLASVFVMSLVACGESEPVSVSENKEKAQVAVTKKEDDKEKTEPSDGGEVSDPTQQPTTKQPTTQQPTTQQPTTQQPTTPTTPTASVFSNNNNYVGAKNQVMIKPKYVYWQNGSLVADCFVINGFDHTVYNINVKSLSFANSSGTIASGSFGYMQNASGLVSIAPNSYIVWTFVFGPNLVSMQNANLYELDCRSHVSNSY